MSSKYGPYKRAYNKNVRKWKYYYLAKIYGLPKTIKYTIQTLTKQQKTIEKWKKNYNTHTK